MRVAIIGGTGLCNLENLEVVRHQVIATPYGEPSSPATIGRMAGVDVVFLPRHGYSHRIPPHMINYRANIWALRELGVEAILAVAAVGGITGRMAPGVLCVPDQIIDYTWGRSSTFFDHDLESVTHVDFSFPYDARLRAAYLSACQAAGVEAIDGGTYGATQGPRLETAAEIRRLEQDGCDVVGMTGMPEAVLARELGIAYASLNVVANRAAGKEGDEVITMAQIEQTIDECMARVKQILAQVLMQELVD
ncbi:MAG: S-methyl-5'-thioinosine phosphorylase [Halothiobacillaceae bacterium]